jgi:cytochrome c-type biogenesis protein CcmH
VRSLLLALLLACQVTAVQAATSPVEMLQDPTQEERARALGQTLRCLVCQNQSIDDSDADLARDLRALVRQQILAGQSDEAIRQHLVDRYGAFILLKPPVEPATLALWLGPPALLLLGGGLVFLVMRRARRLRDDEPAPLTAEEQAQLATLEADGTIPPEVGRR